jgi:hypothetical protein
VNPRRHLGFIGVDGEGYRNEEGDELYWLLRVGDRQIVAEPGQRLTTRECLEFLFASRKPGYFLVGFALNYDWDHILRNMTDERFTGTRKEERGAWYTTGKWRYRVKRVKCKFLEVTRWPKEGGKGERLVLFDTFSFFQASFLTAITDWKIGTDEERAFIERMKGCRNDFAAMDREEIGRYNELECDLLSRLMARFDAVVQEAIGIRLRSWHGPGGLAKAALKQFGLSASIFAWQAADLPEGFLDASCRAFFGGWFQLFRVGHFLKLFQADINSAYPDQTRDLPALGGTVHYVTEYDPSVYAIWHVTWKTDCLKTIIRPFPYRLSDGSVHRPPCGNGWYWQEEVRAAKELYGDAIEVLEGWVYTPPTDEKPFRDLVNSLYATRLSLGKTSAGVVIKLFLNSIYGVLAQSPIHGNKALGCVMWAGMITSGTRAKLLRAAMQAPEDAVYVATDGLLTSERPDLPYSKELGEWDLDEFDSGQVYQPGIYRLNGAKPKVKVRGMRKDELLDWDAAAAEWVAKGENGALTVTTGDRYLTRDLAIHFGHQPYRWRPETKTLTLHPGAGFPNWAGEWKDGETRWETWDLWAEKTYLEVVSAPYRKLAETTAAISDAITLIRENYTEE